MTEAVAEVLPAGAIEQLKAIFAAGRTGTLVFDVKLGKILHGKFQETEHISLDKKETCST